MKRGGEGGGGLSLSYIVFEEKVGKSLAFLVFLKRSGGVGGGEGGLLLSYSEVKGEEGLSLSYSVFEVKGESLSLSQE